MLKSEFFLLWLSIFAIILISTNVMELGEAVEINCKYSSDFDWFTVGKVYTCSVQQKLDALHVDSGVIGVNGNHIGQKTNKDVKAIRIYNRNVYYFSSGYDKYFTNIEVIQVYDSKLKLITQKDLKPFPKLKHIDLSKNDLEELEKDLFKFNGLLEVIKANDNKLKFIDVTAFEGLYQLHTLELNGNHCIWKSTTSRDNWDEEEEISREEAIDIMYEGRTRCYRDYILKELYEMEMGKYLKERSDVVTALQTKIDDLTSENDVFYDRMRKYKDDLDLCLSKEINMQAEDMKMMMEMQMNASTVPVGMPNGQQRNGQDFGPPGQQRNGQDFGPQGQQRNGQDFGPQGQQPNGNVQQRNGLEMNGIQGNIQQRNLVSQNINGIPRNELQRPGQDGGRYTQNSWNGWDKNGRNFRQTPYGNDREYSWRGY